MHGNSVIRFDAV